MKLNDTYHFFSNSYFCYPIYSLIIYFLKYFLSLYLFKKRDTKNAIIGIIAAYILVNIPPPR